MARYRDPLTKDLFAWQPPQIGVGYGAEVAGRGALDNKIARLIGKTQNRPIDQGGTGAATIAHRDALRAGCRLCGRVHGLG